MIDKTEPGVKINSYEVSEAAGGHEILHNIEPSNIILLYMK